MVDWLISMIRISPVHKNGLGRRLNKDTMLGTQWPCYLVPSLFLLFWPPLCPSSLVPRPCPVFCRFQYGKVGSDRSICFFMLYHSTTSFFLKHCIHQIGRKNLPLNSSKSWTGPENEASAHAQLNLFYHLFVTHVRKDTRKSLSLSYCN